MAVDAGKKEEAIVKETSPKAFVFPGGAPLRIARIKYDGIFDWSGLYKLIYEWFTNRGYYFEETKVKHKIPTPMGAEEEYAFSGWRKTTEYMIEWINLDLHFYEMREIDVIKDGVKQKLVKARVVITFGGKIETGYQERWDETQLGHYLKKILEGYLIRKDVESVWWDRLYYIMYKLHNEVKMFLDLQAKENAYYDIW